MLRPTYVRTDVEPILNSLREMFEDAGLLFLPCGWFRRGKDKGGVIRCAVDNLHRASLIILYNRKWKTEIQIHAKPERTKIVKCMLNGIRLELFQAYADEWGAMSLFLTGNMEFTIDIRKHARKQDCILNQYGLWFYGEQMAGKTELQIFFALGLCYQPPNERVGKSLQPIGMR